MRQSGEVVGSHCQYEAGPDPFEAAIDGLCIDPAESAQVKPLKHKPQRGFSCPAPDAGAGGCRS